MATNPVKTLRDQVSIRFPGVEVRFQRAYQGNEGHEISVVLPRVEIKQSIRVLGLVVISREVVINSVTIVDAPRHLPIDQPTAGKMNIAYAEPNRALQTGISDRRRKTVYSGTPRPL